MFSLTDLLRNQFLAVFKLLPVEGHRSYMFSMRLPHTVRTFEIVVITTARGLPRNAADAPVLSIDPWALACDGPGLTVPQHTAYCSPSVTVSMPGTVLHGNPAVSGAAVIKKT